MNHDFINQNLAEIVQKSQCPPEHAQFMKEIFLDDLKKFEEDFFNKYSPSSIFTKAIEKNNFELFKKIIDDYAISMRDHMAHIIEFGREDMFEYALKYENAQIALKKANNYCFMLAVRKGLVATQKLILNQFLHEDVNCQNTDEIKSLLSKEIKGKTDVQTISNILTSAALKEFININDVYVNGYNGLNYTCWIIVNEKKDIFDLLMSDKLIHPVNYQANNFQALFCCIEKFKTSPDKLKNCYFFNHFLYDKKIDFESIFLKRFDIYPELRDELMSCIEKRDLFFKMDEQISNIKSSKKAKI